MYLAFDIEAANGFKHYSICSVGIIIADEQFNIVHQENIWINPKTKYNLNGTRENVGIDLHLDKALLDASPDFSQVYPRIKQLLTDKDTIVLGHAVESDVYMLNAACKHYKLPCINFKFICSQLLYRLFKEEKEVKALSKIADSLGITFSAHNSQDDALVSMLTLKYLVEASGLSVQGLLDKFAVRIGENKNFELTRTVSLLQNSGSKTQYKKNLHSIYDYLSKANFARKSNVLSGKVFALARSIEIDNFSKITPILDVIYSNGGKYSHKITKCNYYISNPDSICQQDATREIKVNEKIQSGELTSITLSNLDLMVGEQ